jgi:hypothetical protein
MYSLSTTPPLPEDLSTVDMRRRLREALRGGCVRRKDCAKTQNWAISPAESVFISVL